MKTKIGQLMKCQNCGQMNPRRGPGSQKYCTLCAHKKDSERKRAWAIKNYKSGPLSAQEIEKRRLRGKERTKIIREQGEEISKNSSRSMNWTESHSPSIQRSIRIEIPFDSCLSKNAIYSMAKGSSYIFVKKKHSEARKQIIFLIQNCLKNNERFYQGKIWIDILVQKKTHKSDAINYVDGVCDAIKSAIGVDDNWFSIRMLDWEIVKENPRIFIGIAQEVTEDHRACSYCGQVLPFKFFGNNRADKFGKARGCLACIRVDDKMRRKAKKSLK